MKLRRAVLRGGRAFFHATTAHHSRFLRLDRFSLRFLAPPSSLPFLPSLPPGIPTRAGVFEMAKIQGQRASSLDTSPRENRTGRASNDKKTR